MDMTANAVIARGFAMPHSPRVANGRLSGEQVWVEEHVQSCAKCAEELAVQQRLCEALAVPDRVTYAPGPSFRKLLDIYVIISRRGCW